MSGDPVSATSTAAFDPIARVMAMEQDQGSRAAGALGSGLTLAPTAPVAPVAAPVGAFDVPALYAAMSHGLSEGFFSGDVARLVRKAGEMGRPDSAVTVGEITAEMLNVQAKMGVADACSRIAAKLAEGLQTLVVRQG